MKKTVFIAFTLIFFSCLVFSQNIEEISLQKGFQMLENSSTYLVDVRSIAEYVFVGHPDMAHNIPLKFWSENKQKMETNANFLQDLQSRFKNEDILIFICRSGGRSLKAAKLAKNAGFTQVYSINEGFEGKKDENGHRSVNGWKNSNLPYTYKVKKKLKYK